MKKPLKNNFKVWDKIFGNRIHCYIGYTGEELNQLLKKRYNFKDEIDTDGFNGISIDLINNKSRCVAFIIWLMKFGWSIDDMGGLIHEISHTIDRMFNFNNIPLSKETGEFRAILMDDIWGKIADKLKKRIRRKE